MSEKKPETQPLARPHQRVMKRLNESNRRRYETVIKLIGRICGDHAVAAAQAAERGEDAPEPDSELVSAIAQYAVTGRLE